MVTRTNRSNVVDFQTNSTSKLCVRSVGGYECLPPSVDKTDASNSDIGLYMNERDRPMLSCVSAHPCSRVYYTSWCFFIPRDELRNSRQTSSLWLLGILVTLPTLSHGRCRSPSRVEKRDNCYEIMIMQSHMLEDSLRNAYRPES